MQVATIVPRANLSLVENDLYHLCLIQALKEYDDYFTFYKRMADEQKFVILDNGAAEGKTSTAAELAAYANMIGASEVQLPDVFFDTVQTLKKSEKALKAFDDYGYTGKIMGIPQGGTFEDWTICALEMASWDKVTTLGLPKNLVHTLGPYGRREAMDILIDEGVVPGIEIHLLGCWTSPREVGHLYRLYRRYIRGVDSGIATIYAQAGHKLETEFIPKPKRIVDFNTPCDEALLKRNIGWWRDACYDRVPNMPISQLSQDSCS